MGTFSLVFKNLSALRVDADLECLRAVLDIEGVAQPAAALLLLQFLIGNLAGTRLKRDGTRLLKADFRARLQFLSCTGQALADADQEKSSTGRSDACRPQDFSQTNIHKLPHLLLMPLPILGNRN